MELKDFSGYNKLYRLPVDYGENNFSVYEYYMMQTMQKNAGFYIDNGKFQLFTNLMMSSIGALLLTY